MTTFTNISESYISTSNHSSESPIQHIIEPILPQFDRMIQSYALFNLLFLTIGFAELTLLVIFFTFLTQSAILAFSLAVVFLTFFSYFILRLYFQTQKPLQFQDLKERYITACKGLMNYKEGNAGHHITLTIACTKLSDALRGRANSFYKMPPYLSFVDPYIEKFSFWYYCNDVFKMRELLLISAIEENIKLVKNEPTSVKAHTALANAYVALSGLYVNPHTQIESQWLSESLTEDLEQKYRSAAERAIEEFKILSDFAPNDPWVHKQLAHSYHDLKMPLEEIKEFEIMLELTPGDTENMLKLGTLYFQQGLNSKGLQIYEQLKKSEPQKAELLIGYYGAYLPFKDGV